MRYRYFVWAFFLVIAIAFLVAVNQRPNDVAQFEFALSWSLRLAGGIIAMLGASTLLVQAWEGNGDRLLPALVAVLAGTMLYVPLWATALGLGLIGLGLTLRAWWSKPFDPPRPP